MQKIFVLHISMPKYWGKPIFTHGSFPEVGQKQKTEKKEKRRERDRKLVITMASYALQRHLGWRTQSRLGQKSESVNIGHGGAVGCLCLDGLQKFKFQISNPQVQNQIPIPAWGIYHHKPNRNHCRVQFEFPVLKS